MDTLFEYYKLLYMYTMPFVIVPAWFWITHVDKMHLREKTRLFGWKIQDGLNGVFPRSGKLLVDCCYTQMNAISEMVAGFSDGLIGRKPTITVYSINDTAAQTEENVPTVSIEVQTDVLPEAVTRPSAIAPPVAIAPVITSPTIVQPIAPTAITPPTIVQPIAPTTITQPTIVQSIAQPLIADHPTSAAAEPVRKKRIFTTAKQKRTSISTTNVFEEDLKENAALQPIKKRIRMV